MNATLIAALRERGIIGADAPPPVEPSDRPWFVSLLMGIAGWVAGAFTLVFLAIALDVTTSPPMLLVGVVLLGIAWALYAASKDFVFLDQLALALSIAGQIAVLFFLADKMGNFRHVIAAFLGLQLLVFAVMPDRTARTVAAFAACIAWVLVIRFWLRPYEGGGGFLDAHGNIAAPSFGAWTLPIESLVTWAPPIALVIGLTRSEARWIARRAASFARPALTGLVLAMAVGGICAEPEILLALGDSSLGRDFSLWALIPLLSIGLALFAAHAAFRLRSGALVGIAIVAALAHLARFYYLYGTTLTMKAAIMLAAGLLLLGASGFVARAAPERS